MKVPMKENEWSSPFFTNIREPDIYLDPKLKKVMQRERERENNYSSRIIESWFPVCLES